jgi:hypothetical protein
MGAKREPKTAEFLQNFRAYGAKTSVLGEWIAQSIFIVHEEPDGFGFHGRDDLNPRSRVRRAAVKIMLGQTAHQPIASEEKCERFDHGCLAAVVGSNKHDQPAQRDIR